MVLGGCGGSVQSGAVETPGVGMADAAVVRIAEGTVAYDRVDENGKKGVYVLSLKEGKETRVVAHSSASSRSTKTKSESFGASMMSGISPRLIAWAPLMMRLSPACRKISRR